MYNERLGTHLELIPSNTTHSNLSSFMYTHSSISSVFSKTTLEFIHGPVGFIFSNSSMALLFCFFFKFSCVGTSICTEISVCKCSNVISVANTSMFSGIWTLLNITPQKFNSSSLKIGRNPKQKSTLLTIHFSVAFAVKFRGVSSSPVCR